VGNVRHIGFGLSAGLVVAAVMLGYAGFAAAAGEVSEYASALQKIFVNLDAQGVDIPFGGPIAAPLGIAKQLVQVHELPPVRTSSTDVVHVFNRFDDGSGYVVVRFTPSGYVALRFDKDFNFVRAAIERYGQPPAALSGDAAKDILSQEMRDCKTIANHLAARP
jgi:hypothetical protein